MPGVYLTRCPSCQEFFYWIWDPVKGEWKIPKHELPANPKNESKNGPKQSCKGSGRTVKPVLKGVKA